MIEIIKIILFITMPNGSQDTIELSNMDDMEFVIDELDYDIQLDSMKTSRTYVPSIVEL